MRRPMKLISLRVHPGILALADQFAALPPPDSPAALEIPSAAPENRSDVLRQAIALGLPILINPANHKSKGPNPCRNGKPNRPKTASEQPSA